jgi:hypothetical protein
MDWITQGSLKPEDHKEWRKHLMSDEMSAINRRARDEGYKFIQAFLMGEACRLKRPGVPLDVSRIEVELAARSPLPI